MSRFGKRSRSGLVGTSAFWDDGVLNALVDLLANDSDDARATLARTLPELAELLASDPTAPFEIARRTKGLATDRVLADDLAQVGHPGRILLASLAVSASTEPAELARALCRRLDLQAAAEDEIVAITANAGLIPAAARRDDGSADDVVIGLAAHMEDQHRTRAALLVGAVVGGGLAPGAARIYRLVLDVLARHEGLYQGAAGVIDRRRSAAARLVTDRRAIVRVETAPVIYLLARDSEDLARHCELLDPRPSPGQVRTSVTPTESPGLWNVDIVSRDRPGLLAAFTGALAATAMDVVRADVATWADGVALQAFTVVSDREPDPHDLEAACVAQLDADQTGFALADAQVSFDDEASPWHTVCDIRAGDRHGLLHAVAVAIASVGADVHAARVSTLEGVAIDRFDLTDARGKRLHASQKAALVVAVTGGSRQTRRRRWVPSLYRERSSGVSTSATQRGFSSSTAATRS